MKKRLLTIIVLIAVLIMPKTVKGEDLADLDVIDDVSIGSSRNYELSFKIKGYDIGNNHRQSTFTASIRVGDNCFRTAGAYCVTPGVTNRPNNGYRCTAISTYFTSSRRETVAMYKEIHNIITSGKSQGIIAAAMRMYAGSKHQIVGGVKKYPLRNCNVSNAAQKKKCNDYLNAFEDYYDNSSNPTKITSTGTDLQEIRNLVMDSSSDSLNTTSGRVYECKPLGTSDAQLFYILVQQYTCDITVCTEYSEEIVSEDIEANFKNCCEEDTYSTLQEVTLDELFADYNCLGGITAYAKKIGSDSYIDSTANGSTEAGKMDAEYCQLYCTERVNIAQPGSFNIAVDQYFKPNKIKYPQDAADNDKSAWYHSPVVDNYRRCRVRIRFDKWSQKYYALLSQAVSKMNEYFKTKKLADYYYNAMLYHKNVYDGTGGNYITLTATCERNELTPCDDYTITAPSSPSASEDCTVTGYADCDRGWTEISGNRCQKVDNNATTCTESSTVSCVYNSDTHKYTKTTKKSKNENSWTCKDNAPAALSEENSTKTHTISFKGIRYDLQRTDIEYNKYSVQSSGACTNVYEYYKNTEKDAEFSHPLYSAIATETGVTVAGKINELSSWINDSTNKTGSYDTTLIGKVTCNHNSEKSAYYSVKCTTNYGALQLFDEEGNYLVKNDDNIETLYNDLTKSGGVLDSLAGYYMEAVKNLETHAKKLKVCQTYFSEQYGSDPNHHSIDPQLTFEYEQFYLDNYGKQATSNKIPVTYVKVCDKKTVQVPNVSIYEKQDKIVQITDNSLDQLVAVRYSGACGESQLEYKVLKCNSSTSLSICNYEYSDCTLASTKDILNSAYTGSAVNINAALERRCFTPAFEYDAMYNTTCHWEFLEKDQEGHDINMFTVPQEGKTERNWNYLWPQDADKIVDFTKDTFPFDFNTVRPFYYIGSEYQFDGKYQTYVTLTNVGTGPSGDRFDKYIRENGVSCANKTYGQEGWAPLTCTYSVYGVNSKFGYCEDSSNPGRPVIDKENCKITGQGPLYSFKVIDENNIFPTCGDTSTKSGMEACYTSMAYGYNWLKTEEGQDTLKEIQSADTFNSSNLTYSFKLDSQSMKAIKKYNKERLTKGGYVDNDLSCKLACNEDLDVVSEAHYGSSGYYYWKDGVKVNVYLDVLYYDKACSKCLSSFLTDLSNKKVGTVTLSKDVWNRPGLTINQVRNDTSLMEW